MEENWGVIGHQKIIQFLNKSVASNRVAQTYLFYGQKSLGKTTVAEKFAEKLLGCQEAVATDLYRVEAEPGKKNISMEQVREWRRSLQLKSFYQGYKVGIIYEAEKLNLESANALLKTIEEPAPQTVIILITSAWDKILPTIASRSQLIRFSPLNQNEIAESPMLKKYPIPLVSRIINFTGGYPGLILNFLADQEIFKEYQKIQQNIAKILDSNMAERFLFIEKMLASNEEFNKKVNLSQEYLKHLQKFFRKLFLRHFHLESEGQDQKLSADRKFSLIKIYDCLARILQAEILLKSNVQPRLVLENLFLNI